jgi:hypothetical protein
LCGWLGRFADIRLYLEGVTLPLLGGRRAPVQHTLGCEDPWHGWRIAGQFGKERGVLWILF